MKGPWCPLLLGVPAILFRSARAQRGEKGRFCSTADPCPKGFFCDFHNGNMGHCEGCVGDPDNCHRTDLFHHGSNDCAVACSRENNACSVSTSCPEGLFCNFENGDSGYCEGCTTHSHLCFDRNLTDGGVQDCAASCEVMCMRNSNATVDNVDYESIALFGSPKLSATGPLVDCARGLNTCTGANNSVCLIERGRATFFTKVQNCEMGGGIGAIIYNTENNCEIFPGGLGTGETFIPSVTMAHFVGKNLLDDGLGSIATISVGSAGELCETGCSEQHPCSDDGFTCNFDNYDHGSCESCIPEQSNNFCQVSCNAETPCLGEGLFCNYLFGVAGSCEKCPAEKETNCFYSSLAQTGAEECASVCGGGAQLTFPTCKFCPKDVSVEDVGEGSISEKKENTCEFCGMSPSCSKIDRWNMEYPYREMGIFGSGVRCWVVAEFFRKLEIDANSGTCQLARMFNYICGCEGPGYAGADTATKRALLAWLPRIAAVLSIMGSTFIIVDVLRDRKKREKVFTELMLTLSIFDLVGSVSYALTTLPLPEEDYIYGSKGNDASCRAQGFFIQLGTTSAYINVSLAFYYLFVIKYSWRETGVKKIRRWLLLCPILVGFGLAFAGIPFYDNVILWCNNSAHYWPDIPVAVSILMATIIMSMVCCHVYTEEVVSKKWRRQGETARTGALSQKVFWQSFWYLMAFYLTWPPYLALQYLLASGNAYSMYEFFLISGTVVPLQGFWNCFVYRRARRRNGGICCYGTSSVVSSIGSRFSSQPHTGATQLAGASFTNQSSMDQPSVSCPPVI